MVRRGLSRGRKGEDTMEDEDQANRDGGSKRKTPPWGGSFHRTQRKRGRTNADRHAQLDEDVRREAMDPYHLRDPDHYPQCFREDHARKKNCSENPRCLYGLGEGKQGIWSSNPGLLETLGEDLSGTIKALPAVETPSNGSNKKPAGGVLQKGDVLPPPPNQRLPAGLKNLGATCYLNSQLQALYANKGFRRGVYVWRPSRRGLGAECDMVEGNGVNGFSPCHDHPRRCDAISSSWGLKVESPREANFPDGGRSNGKGCSSAAGVYSGVLPGGTELSEITFVGMGGNSTEAFSTEAFSEEDKDDKIMEELQLVFGHMQEGMAKVYDPTRFAALLGIDKGIQQDPQEFNKLFMPLLERCLQRSAPPLRSLVSGLFCGELAYVTRCLKCNFASRNKNAFNELELQIGCLPESGPRDAGLKCMFADSLWSRQSNRTVENCLDSFLEAESLDGDNQYLCEKCGRKQDAVRAIELHRLPPVLSIQLLRYVYDARTGQRKKIRTPMSLATTLDMGPRLGPQGEAPANSGSGSTANAGDWVYKLACVLYHKGSNVHSGHYIAEVHDPSSNTWTLFDDEKVQRLTGMNSHDPTVAGTGTSSAVDAKPRGKAKRNPRALQKKGDRGGGEAIATAVETAAESHDGAEFLGSADGLADEPDADLKDEGDPGVSSGEDDSKPSPPAAESKGKGETKSKAVSQPRTGVGRHCLALCFPLPLGFGSRWGRLRVVFSRADSRVALVLQDIDVVANFEEDPLMLSRSSSGACRRTKGCNADERHPPRGGAKTKTTCNSNNGNVSNGAGAVITSRNGGTGAVPAGAARLKSRKDGGGAHSKIEVVEERAEEGQEEENDGSGPGDKEDDDDGDNIEVENEDSGGAAGSDDSGSGGSAGSKKHRISEDAYMLIYVREGVAWGPGSEGDNDSPLPAHVREAVEATNGVLAKKVSSFQIGKRRLEAQMKRRKEQYCRLFGPLIKTAPAGRKVENAPVVFRHPGPSDEQLSTDAAAVEARDVAMTTAASLAGAKADVFAEGKASSASLPPGEYFWVDSRWLQQWVIGESLPPPGEAAIVDPVVVDVDGADRGAEPAKKLRVTEGLKGGIAGENKGVAKVNSNGVGNGDAGGPVDAPAFRGGADNQRASEPLVFGEPMRNRELLCDHGALHPASVSRWKLVTRKVYEGLLGEEGVGPPDHHVSAANFRCEHCVEEHICRKESNIMASRESGLLVAELEKAEPAWDSGCHEGEKGPGFDEKRPFAISRKWIVDFKLYHEQFLRSAAKDGTGQAKGGGCVPGKAKTALKPPDERVNSSITCEHGSLVSGRRGLKKKYRMISAEGWDMVRRRFPLASELEYPAGTRPCSICQEQDKDETQLKLDRRKSKSAELRKGPSLRNVLKRGGALPPKLGAVHRRRANRDDGPAAADCRLFLVEARWLAAWRAHHDSSSIHSEPPGRLWNQGLRCEHGLAIMGQRLRRVVEGHLPALAGVSEEGAAAQAEVLTEAEWTDLARCSYIVQEVEGGDSTGSGPNVGDKRGIDEISKGGWGGEVGTPDSRPPSPSSVAEEGAGASCTFEVSFDPRSGWSPGVCEVCMAAASERANLARSVFKDKSVNVVRLEEGESPPAPDPAKASEGGDGVHISASGRLQRRTRAKRARPLTVMCSSDETVNFFKLKIYQFIEVPPRRQTLFLRASPVGEGTDTLQQAGVKAGDTLHLEVKKPSASDAADDASLETELFDGLATKPPPGPERGFAGTALSAGRIVSPPSLPRPPPSTSSSTPGVTPAVEVWGVEGGYLEVPAQVPSPFVACPTCTFHNELTKERCSACGVALYE